ncbi:MAG: hypothetical protein ABJ327_00025, partial [Litoreibacter sp.]
MIKRSIEIYYDISEIPGIGGQSKSSAKALSFLNAAKKHVENALTAANLGKWSGADIGSGEVNFGFNVEDFDLAEAEVRRAVKDTRFENI